MIYCLYKSFCEPKPKDFEHSYQCCNSCNNKKCTNRCKDDCKTCGLVADKEWIEQMKPKSVLELKDNLVKPKKTNRVSEEETMASLLEARKQAKEEKAKSSSELAKKEARKRRREARKNKK